MNRDQIEGKAKSAVGKAQDKAGDAMNDEEMRREGQERQAEGETQGAIGKVKEKAGDAVDAIRDKISRH